MDDVKWLIGREIPRLRRFARTLVDTPHEADDLVQDCIERAIRKRHLWQRRSRIRSWLYRIMYNLFVNQAARRRRDGLQQPIDGASGNQIELVSPARQEGEMTLQDIGAAMARLPPEQRTAIVLIAVEGFSYDEVAAVMGVQVGTVRSRLSRGREHLRRLYFEQEATAPIRRVK